MKNASFQKSQIIRLRLQGKTYSEISDSLGGGIPKSTISYACRNIELNDKAVNTLREKTLKTLEGNRLKALQKNKIILRERLESIKKIAVATVDSGDVSKIALAMLYLGEGSKRPSYRGLSLGSSDPQILSLYIKLLKRCYGIDVSALRFRILYRADQNLSKLEGFWSDQLGFEPTQFYKTTFDKRTVGNPTKNKKYQGVCVISCAGADIQLELEFIAMFYLRSLK